MSFSMNTVGISTTINFLKNKRSRLNNDLIPGGLKKASLFLQGEVKESIAGRKAEPTSVDTGRFLNSVDFNVGKKNAKVFTLLKYAKFLEFGTSHIRARKHFRNSKDRNKGKIANIIRTVVKGI